MIVLFKKLNYAVYSRKENKMNVYKKSYTEKFPFQYTVESDKYIIHTCNENAYNNLINQVNEKGIIEFTPEILGKLQRVGVFTIIKKS